MRRTNVRSGRLAAVLISIVSLAGCSRVNDNDAAYYTGNEEATREHMQEIQDEERAHAREVGQTAAPAVQSVEDQERAQRTNR